MIRVERLRGRDGGPDVRAGGTPLGALLEAEIRRDCDRQQNGDDDEDDEQLDEGEALLALDSPLKPAEKHVLLLPGSGTDSAGIDLAAPRT